MISKKKDKKFISLKGSLKFNKNYSDEEADKAILNAFTSGIFREFVGVRS